LRLLLGADPRESATITAVLVTALLGSGLLAGTVPAVSDSLSSGPVVAVLAALGALVGAWAARTRRGLLAAVVVPAALFAGVVLAGGLVATYGGPASTTSRYLVAPGVIGLVAGTPVGVGGYGVAAAAGRYADAE
jgi:small basic protein